MGAAGGLVWWLLVYPARRVAVGRDIAGRGVLCREWPAAAVGDESTERRGAWVRVHAYLDKLAAKRAHAAARRRLGFPLPSVKAKAQGSGSGGAWVKGQSGKVKRLSTKGGLSVRSTELARLLADWSARFRRDGAAGAVCCRVEQLPLLPVAVALATGYAAAAGSLFAELQGQQNLALCAGMARGVVAKMRSAGKATSSTTADDAASAAGLALVRWRDINGRFPGSRVRGSAGAVAWAAVSRDIQRDCLGDIGGAAVYFEDQAPQALAASVVPLPAFVGDESRDDKAARLLYGRARGQRVSKLAARLAALQAAAVGRRVASVAKVGHAAALMLGGLSLDSAAVSAGYKSSSTGRGRRRAGDSLAPAVRRLGCSFQFNLRLGAASLADVRALVQAVSERGFLCWHEVERGAALSVPALAAAWAARSSAKLKLQRGKLPGREVKRVAQLTARAARRGQRRAVAAALAAAVQRCGQRQKRTARRVARRTAVSAKLHGGRLGALATVEPDGAAIRTARLLAAWRGKVWGAV